MFASNVGVLPTKPDGCVLDPGIVLSIPDDDLGRRCRKRRKKLRRELLRCACNETIGARPTVDARTASGR